MANLSDVFLLLRQIREDLPALVERSKITAKQIVTFTGLSDISERLGLIQAGEFRAGNSVEPGYGFSGVRTGYPAFLYNGELWNIAGVENDKLQFGLRSSDGKAIAGGGAVVIDEDGILLSDAGDAIVFFDSQTITNSIISQATNTVGQRLGRLQTFQLDSITNLVANGDFDTGSFSSWTEVDAGSHISISNNGDGYGGGYAAHFESALGTEYIEQTIASSPFGVMVRLKIKSTDVFNLILTGGTQKNINETTTNGEWRTFYVPVLGSTTNIRISVTQSANTYIDNVVVYPLDGTGTTTFFSSLDVAKQYIEAATHIFRINDLENNNIIYVETDGADKKILLNADGEDRDTTIFGNTDFSLFKVDAGLDAIGMGGAAESGYKLKVSGKVNLTSGSTYDINGSPHTHSDADIIFTDITTNNASTTKHGFAPKATAPASGLLSVLGIGNGETVRSDKALFDNTNPADVGTAAPGTALVAARRDHVHGGSSGASSNGWNAAAGTWSYSSTDDPTGIVTSNTDETDEIAVGDKIKFTNAGNTIYGIVTAISFSSPNTTIKFLHQIDPADNLALVLLANSAITNPYFSHVKNPYGFPASKLSWRILIKDTNNATQATPGTTIYNLGSISIDIPIGLWDVRTYSLSEAVVNLAAVQNRSVQTGLSTANNSYSDVELYSLVFLTTPALANATARAGILLQKRLDLTSKTTYYLNCSCGGATAATSISFRGDLATTQIEAVCAYL